jgi:hypothetical protein
MGEGVRRPAGAGGADPYSLRGAAVTGAGAGAAGADGAGADGVGAAGAGAAGAGAGAVGAAGVGAAGAGAAGVGAAGADPYSPRGDESGWVAPAYSRGDAVHIVSTQDNPSNGERERVQFLVSVTTGAAAGGVIGAGGPAASPVSTNPNPQTDTSGEVIVGQHTSSGGISGGSSGSRGGHEGSQRSYTHSSQHTTSARRVQTRPDNHHIPATDADVDDRSPARMPATAAAAAGATTGAAATAPGAGRVHEEPRVGCA